MNDVKLVSKIALQVWIALQSWASEGGPERQEVHSSYRYIIA